MDILIKLIILQTIFSFYLFYVYATEKEKHTEKLPLARFYCKLLFREKNQIVKNFDPFPITPGNRKHNELNKLAISYSI